MRIGKWIGAREAKRINVYEDKGEKMNQSDYKLGLASISFRDHTPEEILKAAKAAGLSCIEWGSDVHAPRNDMHKLHKIVQLQLEYGISCSSYGTYFRIGVHPLEELIEYIAAAKVLGTRVLRLWGGVKNGQNMTEDERKHFIYCCQKAAAMAQAQDVILCLECHMCTITEHPEDAVALMKTVNSPHFRMYWQPFQWLSNEENLSIAHMVAPYTENIHVFNWHGSEKFSLTQAIHTWREYLSRFSPPRALLLEFMPDDRLESLEKEAAALKNIVGECKCI